MLGQFFSQTDEKFNVVILAGGLGTRMGSASEHLPKALTRIGSQRAIDLILSKFLLVADPFVIGTGWQADLLESYVRGRYPNLRIVFSREVVADLRSNAISLMYALDNVDSRKGTILSFCDLLLLSNPAIPAESAIYLANTRTTGVVGTFRHSAVAHGGTVRKVIPSKRPLPLSPKRNGLIGFFVLQNTVLLKEITYSLARKGALTDISTDIVARYVAEEETKAIAVEALLEFGTDVDLQKARKAWETY